MKKSINKIESAESLRLLSAEAENGKHTAKAFYTLWSTAKQVLLVEDQNTFFHVLKSYSSVKGWYGKEAYAKYGSVKAKSDKAPINPPKPEASKPAAKKSAKQTKSGKPAAKKSAKQTKLPDVIHTLPDGCVMKLADGTTTTHYVVVDGIVLPVVLA